MPIEPFKKQFCSGLGCTHYMPSMLHCHQILRSNLLIYFIHSVNTADCLECYCKSLLDKLVRNPFPQQYEMEMAAQFQSVYYLVMK